VKVALSGVGGDEILGGYSNFQRIPRVVSGLGPFARVPGIGRVARWLAAPLVKPFAPP
jgi:asparagine synthase (glutamine-hydrolysing)